MKPILFHPDNWDFVNMNSPADLNAEYGAEGVRIYEYDRCRGGHILLSRQVCKTDDVTFRLTVADMQDGVGFGVYGGRGAFSHYCYAAVFRDKVELRIPSGVPNGDMFMHEGQKNYYTVASQTLEDLPESFRVEFSASSQGCVVRVNDRTIVKADVPCLADVGESCRMFVKALNERNIRPKTKASVREFYYEKGQDVIPLLGRVVDASGPLPFCSVHVAGYGDFRTMTDHEGRFRFDQLPVGSYTVIAGKEGYTFSSRDIRHRGESDCVIQLECEGKSLPRSEYPRAELWRSSKWLCLNGNWSFDFDPEDSGEREAWFVPDRHRFGRSIHVPFPWSSLSAFGESFLADSDTLYHANPFTNNSNITGGVAWYRREIRVPDDFDGSKSCSLHFNAVAGVSKVWVDGEFKGMILDSYNRYTFPLGSLKPGSLHVIVVKVVYPFSANQVCMGKQGFWFTESPGIWQSVWLENTEDIAVEDIHVDYDLTFTGQQCREADIRGHVLLDTVQQTEVRDANVSVPLIADRQAGELTIDVTRSDVYKLILNYVADKGRVRAGVYVNGTYECELTFDCTLDSALEDRQSVWLPLRQGLNRITLVKLEDKLSLGRPDCLLTGLNVYEARANVETRITITSPEGRPVYDEEGKAVCRNGRLYVPFELKLARPALWDFGDPACYRVRVEVNGEEKHAAERKFGMRLIETGWSEDRSEDRSTELQHIMLNKRPVFLEGIMDQGYNPWGVYTYPSVYGDKGSMEYDIGKAAELGYNLIRMHIKDNEPHWYAICDDVGMPVWDELPANFYAKAEDPVWRGMYLRQLRAMMEKHGYHPSVILFSAFNESWGIEGWHERSPWDNPDAQVFIKESALEYKSGRQHVLVIDNSGYAKTSATDIIDHHSYPIGYEDSIAFWKDLLDQDYSGSTFNFYHQANTELMRDPQVRRLLQRNCSQDLGDMRYAGQETQAGQPVLISEFVHTDGNERYLKMFPKVSGYTRMNLASQENEDTSYMNQLRVCRDFGYVDEHMVPLDPRFIHSRNAVVIHYPRLSRVRPGESLQLDVHVSLWQTVSGPLQLELTAVGINRRGDYEKVRLEERRIATEMYRSYLAGSFTFSLPEHYKAAYVFAVLKQEDRTVAQDYVQVVMDANERPADAPDGSVELRIGPDTRLQADRFGGIEANDDSSLAWIYGTGKLELVQPLHEDQLRALKTAMGDVSFIFEASSCEIIKGVKITDEIRFPSRIRIAVNDVPLQEIELEDCPYDDRALFSNAAAMRGDIFQYNEHSGWGYGYKQVIRLETRHLAAVASDREIRLTIEALDHGVIVYGHNMGRYGTTPFIITGGERTC